jgi:hypothetical protein
MVSTRESGPLAPPDPPPFIADAEQQQPHNPRGVGDSAEEGD